LAVADRDITDLAAAVSDGDIVDWHAAKNRLSSSRDHEVVEGLETLSRLSAGAQTTDPPSPTRQRLPRILEVVRPLAILISTLGLIGLAATLLASGDPYIALLLTELGSFAGSAIFLDLGGADRRARALATCYWTIAASFAMRGIAWYTAQWPEASWPPLLASLRVEPFLPAALWQFAREFPVIRRFSMLDTACVIALRATLVTGVVLFAVNLLPMVGLPDATWLSALQRSRGFDPWFWNIVFCSALPALGVIAWRGRRAHGDEAARVRLFLYAITISISPVVIEVLAEGLVPGYAAIIHTPRGRWWGGWLIYPPLLALPALTAYAVLVDSVLEVRVVIQQGLRYLLAKWLITWGAVLPLVLLAVYVYRQRDQTLTAVLSSPLARGLIWLDVLAVVILMCRSMVLRVFDRWAMPGASDPSSTLAQMAERMKHMRTPLEVGDLLARAAERALQAPAEAYLVRDGRLVPIRESDSANPRQSLIPVLLEGNREPCVVSPRARHSYYSLMSESDRQWIDDHEICVVIPVLAGRNRHGLAGVVALKHRRNALEYSQADLRFLRAGAASASLALDAIEGAALQTAADGRTEPEELARECGRCGLVDTWSPDERPCVCGGTWEPAALPKCLANDFDLLARLGRGGMGTVYRAVDRSLSREVAVKTLAHVSEAAATRLAWEDKAMAELAHPNIAVLYGMRTWRATPVLIMEYLAGGTLAQRLSRAALSPIDALSLVGSLAVSLQHVHQTGMYHGDIKPSNIGFTAGGVAKFLDFGLTRVVNNSQLGNQALDRPEPARPVAGTLAYLSPEVRDGQAPGPVLDVWALSVVLCECLLGAHPFLRAHTSSEIASAVATAVATLRRTTGPTLCDLLARALSIDPQRRPHTAIELVHALEVVTRAAAD
jgi:hypothetical protein